MFADVRAALLQVRQRQIENGVNQCVVDGYSNFVFHNRYGEMLTPHAVNRAIDRIIRDCNLEETEQAKQEQREPVLLPHFSVHNLRHTFCTRLCGAFCAVSRRRSSAVPCAKNWSICWIVRWCGSARKRTTVPSTCAPARAKWRRNSPQSLSAGMIRAKRSDRPDTSSAPKKRPSCRWRAIKSLTRTAANTSGRLSASR